MRYQSPQKATESFDDQKWQLELCVRIMSIWGYIGHFSIADTNKSIIMNYALSWRKSTLRRERIKKSSSTTKVIASKTWMPELPTEVDMSYLSNPEPLTYPNMPEAYVF